MKNQFIHIKKLACVFLTLLLLLVAYPFSIHAASKNQINSIQIQVDLNTDGSAMITEKWKIVASSGTELYIVKDNLDNQTISLLSVTDETGKDYDILSVWDTESDLAGKANKCGLVRLDNGYEICMGLGSYGAKEFTIVYSMTNVVKGYDGADAINQWFVSTNLMSTVKEVELIVEKKGTAFSRQNTGVWGFGHEGEINVDDGKVILNNHASLKQDEYVAVLIEFEKGIFMPKESVDTSFKEVKEAALQGSSYKPGFGDSAFGRWISRWWKIFTGILASIAVIVGVLIFNKNRKVKSKSGITYSLKEIRKLKKNASYSRTLPWEKQFVVTYNVLKDTHQLKDDGQIIGAFLLRWIWNRQVSIVETNDSKNNFKIKLHNARDTMVPLERELYNMMTSAAGANWILEDKEFETWTSTYYTHVDKWMTKLSAESDRQMSLLKVLTADQDKSKKTIQLNEKGIRYCEEMFGFEKYLKDFTIINERSAKEVSLWKSYLVYAQIFGIAEQVAEQFKDIYPEYSNMAPEQGGLGYDPLKSMRIMWMVNHFSKSASKGYRAGHAAHNTKYSGGGGRFSGGGGSFGSGAGSSGGGVR